MAAPVCRVRCVTYLPGRPLAELTPSVTRWRALGRFMAQVDDVLTPKVLEASMLEHRAIAAAILERDPRAAAAALRAHLERAAAMAITRPED